MSKKIGYIDESGDKSIHFEKGGVSTFFIVSAIIIDENSISRGREEFREIAKIIPMIETLGKNRHCN